MAGERCVTLTGNFLGCGLTLWGSWQLSTAVGVFIGAQVSESVRSILDFTLPLTFIAIVVPGLKDKASTAAAVCAGIVAVVAFNLDYKLGLIVAAIAGISVGIAAERSFSSRVALTDLASSRNQVCERGLRMSLLIFKLTITPLLIALNSLVGRRWGVVVSGFMTGLPLTSGPVSVFLALQNGNVFAAESAIGTIGGKVSVGVLCLTYFWLCQRVTWRISLVMAFAAFSATTMLWNQFALSLWPTFIASIVAIALLAHLMPKRAATFSKSQPVWWDIPMRMVLAATFVVLITQMANPLGPQLSGLISPFPTFITLLAVFAHVQHGPAAAQQYLRSSVIGSLSFSVFFLVVSLLLVSMGPLWTYPLATIAALAVTGLSFFFNKRNS